MKQPAFPKASLFVLGLVVLVGLPAWGDDDRRTGVYVGVAGAAAISLFQDQLEPFVPANPQLGDSAGFQIKLGYRLAAWLALEAQYEWLNEFVLTQTSNTTYESKTIAEFRPQTVTANFKLILPTGRLEPHLIIGIGASFWDAKLLNANVSKSDSAFAARLGAGIDFHLNRSWVLQVTGTGVLGTAEFDPERENVPFPIDELYYFSVAAGVLYRF